MQLPREQQEKLIYDSKYHSSQIALENVARISSKSGRAINMMFVASRADIKAVLQHSMNGYEVILTNLEKPVFTIQINKKKDEKNPNAPIETIRALCIPSTRDSMYLLVSDYKTSLFKKMIVRLVNKRYPLLSRVFIRDVELLRILQSLRKFRDIRTKIYKILYTSRISNELQEKDLKWTARDFEEVFEEIAQQNSWIKKIDFKSWLEEVRFDFVTQELRFDGSITRDCIFKIKMNFPRFYESVVMPLLDMVATRLGYLERRAETACKWKPEPIVIKFPESVFKGERWNEKFIDNMAEMSNVSVNEYHTNPYVHISLLDYQDGSSYGIWIVSEDAVNIIPQGRATIASMTRLLNHVFQRVREGEITDYAPI